MTPRRISKPIANGFTTSECIFEAPRHRSRLIELEDELSRPDLWDVPAVAQRLLKERRRSEETIALDSRLGDGVDDIDTLLELLAEGEDVAADLDRARAQLAKHVRAAELRMLLGEEADRGNAVIQIHPGAGGTEAQDWAAMLARQYLRYCERKGFKTEVVDHQPGDEAGVKNVTMTVEGDYAYGLLKAEAGVHRLVRISPFDAAKRRHTSFASVWTFPEADEIEIELHPDDLRIDTYRSSGSGGQHVNVTDSAVRITHHPTGIVVQCQNERSQHRNKDSAMRVLKARLYQLELEKERERVASKSGEKKEIAFGSQIRSYVLHPYKLVKDHRTSVEITDPDRVLDGDLDDLIRAFLMQRSLADQRPAS